MKGYLSGKAKLVVCAMFFLSGATALFYEVLWARLLHLVFGDTLLAVSTVLAAFMAGLALGSYLLGRWIDARPRAGLRLYAALEIGIGGYALLVPLMLQWLTPVCTLAIEHYRASFYLLGLIRFGISFLLLLPPTTLMGGSLPVLIRYLAGHRSEAGGIAGTLYAVNTLGAVVGCLLPSFVLIGVFGIQHTIYGAAAVNLLAGLMALILDWASAAPAVPPRTVKYSRAIRAA